MRRTGFKSRGKPLKRGGPLRRFIPLVSRTKLARTSSLESGTSGVEESTGRDRLGSGRPSRGHRVPADVAAIIEKRSGGSCEIRLPECRVRPIQKHHRITQKAGGRHGAAAVRSDRPSNILAACPRCHDTITRLPLWAKRWEHGWALNENDEPSQRPVLRRGELVYLDDVGGVWSYEEADA